MNPYNQKSDALKYLEDNKYNPIEKSVSLMFRNYVLSKTQKDFTGGRVVDLGCGPFTTLHYFSHLGFRTYAGIDQSVDMLNLAKQEARKANKRFVSQYADLNNDTLPLPAQFADLVLCEGLLPYLDSPHHCFSEVARILKPTGYLGFVTVTISDDIQAKHVPFALPGFQTSKCHSIAEIRYGLKKANLAIVDMLEAELPDQYHMQGFITSQCLCVAKLK